jgi:two-component system OmpR family sensor kinase/two-component system sensor histidine kinase BaeS
MNRLWVRLSLAYTLTVFLSIVIVMSTTRLVSQGVGLQGFFIDEVQSPGGLLDALSLFYAQNGSWDKLRDFWANRNRIFTLAPEINIKVSVLDENHKPIDANTTLPDDPARSAELPIKVNDEIKGYLLLDQSALPPEPRPDAALIARVLGLLIIFSALTGLMSIVVGTLLSRSLTAPLNRLAEVAHSIGSRKQYQQVKEEGTLEVRELARAFNGMTTALQESETLRRNMVADVAHELRTPLTVLQGNLSAILDGVYPMNREEISSLYHQTTVLNRLVNDLHELSQAEAAKLPLNKQHTVIGALLRDQVNTFSTIAEAEGVTLAFEETPNLPPLMVDPVRISQAVANLVSNALAHTPKGGKVRVTVGRNNTALQIRVEDTGEGISAEHLPYIFDRFYRADPSRTRATGGAGLGLAITKALIEAHGGSISANSEGIAGKGSTFEIVLPIVY